MNLEVLKKRDMAKLQGNVVHVTELFWENFGKKSSQLQTNRT